MQKQKASSKPGRDLAVSQYAFQAPTNNLLDDDTFDTIRFCDTIPTAVEEGGGDGSSSNAHIASTTATSTSTTAAAANVVPRVVIEDMSMADLIARTVSFIIICTQSYINICHVYFPPNVYTNNLYTTHIYHILLLHI